MLACRLIGLASIRYSRTSLGVNFLGKIFKYLKYFISKLFKVKDKIY